MAVTVQSNGSQAATVGTEHTLATLASPGVYQLFVDASALVGGSSPDELELREYFKPTSGGTERLLTIWDIIGSQSEDIVLTPPRLSNASLRYTLFQRTGTSRTFPWAVQANGSAPSEQSSSSQTAVIGTEHTLATITAAGIYQLSVDTNAAIGGTTPDEGIIREYVKPASGGVEQLCGQYAFFGATLEKILLTPPRISAISVKYTLTQLAGTGRAFPWAIQQLT